MLIDKSYFIGELNIPNVDYLDGESMLTDLLQDTEPKFLQSLMGYDLFKQFTAGILVDPMLQKWADIKNGVEFSGFDGRLKNWKGLVNDDKKSPLAYYTFYQYMKRTVTQTAAMGEVRTKNENSELVAPAPKMARIWNQMVEQNILLREFLNVNYATYGDYGSDYNLVRKINPYNL